MGYTRPERDSGTFHNTGDSPRRPSTRKSRLRLVDGLSVAEDELYHHGWTTPWYTWRIRLAVAYDEPIDDINPFKDDVIEDTLVAWGDFDNDGDDDLMASVLGSLKIRAMEPLSRFPMLPYRPISPEVVVHG